MNTRLFKVFLLVLGSGVFLADSTFAQGRVRVHAAAGLTKALSPANFSNRYRSGLNGGTTIGYELERIRFEPMASVMYTGYKIDPASFRSETPEIDGGDRTIWSAAVGTYFHMNSGATSYRGRTHLYVLAQLGIHGVQVDGATIQTTEGSSGWEARSETRFGGLMGMGLEVPIVDRFSFKLEPAVNTISTSGVRTSVFLLRAGFIYNRP